MRSSRDIFNLIKADPSRADLFKELGINYENSSKYKEALKCYEKALSISPGHTEALSAKARVMDLLGYTEEALDIYKGLLSVNPNNALWHNDIALLYKKKGQFMKALEGFKRAIVLNPAEAKHYINLGNLLHECSLVDEAIACYLAALHSNPESCEAHNNIAIAYKDNHNLESAFSHFLIALELCPDIPEIHWNYSLALLLAGRYIEGFREHEWRWLKQDYKPYRRDYNCPMWDGSPLEATVLIFAEQGMGDAIQFVRYIDMVKSRGLRVVLQCHKELASLLSTVNGVEQVISFDEPLPAFDVYCPLMSLPYIFQTHIDSIPAKMPYIAASSAYLDRWLKRLDFSGLKVGIVWAGRAEHVDDKNRSMTLKDFEPLLGLRDVRFYSLQKGQASSQTKSYHNIVDLSSDIEDFSDTAAIISKLDIIITVDTSVAHLAGAMDREVWVLLPFSPDWRWMLHRKDSPWYPRARLFRQKRRGDWSGVIEEVKRHWMYSIS